MQIPASLPLYSEFGVGEGKKRGVLTLDRENRELVFSVRTLFSSRRWVSVLFADVESVVVAEHGFLPKRHAVVVALSSPRIIAGLTRRDLWFWTSRARAIAIKSEWEDFRNLCALEENSRARLKALVVGTFACSARRNVPRFASDHFSDLRACVGPSLSQSQAVPFVLEYLRSAILDGSLNGVIDDDSLDYIDKAALSSEQRIINVDIDFAKLIDMLSRKGIDLTAADCPRCGGSCDLPREGNAFKCIWCGASVHVVDLWDRVRDIVS